MADQDKVQGKEAAAEIGRVCAEPIFVKILHDNLALGLLAGDYVACNSRLQPTGVIRRLPPEMGDIFRATYGAQIQEMYAGAAPRELPAEIRGVLPPDAS